MLARGLRARGGAAREGQGEACTEEGHERSVRYHPRVRIVRAAAAATAALLVASAAAAQPAPLSAEQRRIANDVENGRHGQSDDRSYVISNEWAHRLYFPHIEGLGGAMVSVGADQGYTMAAVARSELLYPVDYDPVIAATHRLYGVLVPDAETPEALVEQFRPEAEPDVLRRIEEQLGAEAAPVVDVYQHYRGRLQVYLRRLSRYGAGRTWLNDPALYAWIRALHRGGRVVPRTCDVTGPPTLGDIGDATRRLGIPVRAVYLSNLEMFVPNRPPLVANMRALNTDERSVLLRTAYSPRLRSAPRDHWHYIVEPFPDYLARLATGRYLYANTIVEDLIRTRRGGDGFSLLDSSVPMRAPR